MAESVDINLVNNEPNVDSWSLGCDIIIEEADTDIQEIRLRDIGLIGDIYTGEVPVEINPDLVNVMDLDVNVTIDGVNPNIVESQVVTYDKILKITDYSPETTNETRYAASARSAKIISDLIKSIGNRVDILETLGGGSEGGPSISEEKLKELIEKYFGEMFYWADEAHTTIGTTRNFFSEQNISSKGIAEEGEGPSPGLDEEQLQEYLDEHKYITEDEITELIPDFKDDIDRLDDEIIALKEKDNQLDLAIKEVEDKSNMFEWVYDSNGNRKIKTSYDLFSEGSVSSKGMSTEGSGSSGGGDVSVIYVNGEYYDSENGVITLPDYPEKQSYDKEISELKSADELFRNKTNKHEVDIEALKETDKTYGEKLKKIQEITDLFYKTNDGKSVGVKVNLFSEKGIASKGLSSGGGSEEEGEGESGTTTGTYQMYKHVQSIPSDTWRILHGLHKYPNVKIVDSMKQLCYGDVIYESEDIVEVKFGAAESGVAYLD